ncbi:RNA polymerase sigma factor sigA-like isoform X2 [Silene latifolia]|uniref:RNA polymerase sigma factor sigA-like isoform X2 n=1 Tax=Silene latifolia TaxID=37657 RepID=UPI003D77676D
MMATAAVVGLSAGKRMLTSSFCYSDLTEKLSYATDQQHQIPSAKSVIIAKKTTSFNPGGARGSSPKALKECIDGPTIQHSEPWVQRYPPSEEDSWEPESSIEALLLLQKSMLEKQLELSLDHSGVTDKFRERTNKELRVTSSGIPARVRRINSKKKTQSKNSMKHSHEKLPTPTVSPELLQSHMVGYVRGLTTNELLTHAQVVNLSRKIRTGLSLEEHRSRLKEKIGSEPSDDQLAMSLKMNRAELRSKLIECTLAREKLAMSNVRLVMSIAQRYENMGADMADLVQGGLIGLLRGIEKFDSAKGFKISTYVYWWIRQGVSKALVESSRTLRLPTHLHERLSLIRGAKNRLEEKGITPSIDRIAETLNMSHKKVKNATEAVRSVLSLDREPFPSLNGVPGKTYHSYVADNRLENNPWHGVDELTLKNEVSDLIDTALRERERDIIRLYYGLDEDSLTWEEISKRMGLSRERVRQVGLVALEKLKLAARKSRMDALLDTTGHSFA